MQPLKWVSIFMNKLTKTWWPEIVSICSLVQQIVIQRMNISYISYYLSDISVYAINSLFVSFWPPAHDDKKVKERLDIIDKISCVKLMSLVLH